MKPVNRFVALAITPLYVYCQETAPFPAPPPGISSVASIVSADEPGTRLVITGTVYRSDRITPYPHLVLYFYQTDETGVYNKTDRSFLRPRLHGWLKTGPDGRYEIRTIKPGSYPGRTEPAHIHVTTMIDGNRAQWLDSYLFADDPFLNVKNREYPQQQGRFSPVVKLNKDKNGVLHAARDIAVSNR